MRFSQKDIIIFSFSIVFGFLLTISAFKVISDQQVSNLISPYLEKTNIPKFANFSPEQPPQLSLKANIVTNSGEVLWQSRVATESSKVALPPKIEQGEVLKTGDDGNIIVQFPSIVTLSISPKTEINFAQTLPVNLVFVQLTGTVKYSKLDTTTVSIRALHLLINQNPGDVLVNIDKETNKITVEVIKGDVNLAFNDSQNTSQVFNLNSGKEYIFNDNLRTGKVKSLQ